MEWTSWRITNQLIGTTGSAIQKAMLQAGAWGGATSRGNVAEKKEPSGSVTTSLTCQRPVMGTLNCAA